MAHEYEPRSRSFESSGDLSASQFCFVKIDSNGRVAVASDGGADAIGVMSDKPAALGRAARVVTGGTAMVKAGGTITAGDAISCDGNGAAVAVGTDDARLGHAVDGGGSGAIISVLLDTRAT